MQAYAQKLTGKWTPVLRPANAMPTTGIFYSAQTRDVLEAEFLRVGCELLARCRQSLASMRPLGFSRMPTLGFGVVFTTYRNCPNNAPLAMWWSAPTAQGDAWYPLMPRRTAATTIASAEPFLERLRRVAEQKAPPPRPVPAPTPTPLAMLVEMDHEGDDSAWDSAADEALSHALDGLEFDVSAGVARFPTEDDCEEFSARDSLEYDLAEIYTDNARSENVPYDGGEEVFELATDPRGDRSARGPLPE